MLVFGEDTSHATPEGAYFCDMLIHLETFGESLNEVHHITNRIYIGLYLPTFTITFKPNVGYIYHHFKPNVGYIYHYFKPNVGYIYHHFKPNVGYMYHHFKPNVGKYTSPMDPIRYHFLNLIVSVICKNIALSFVTTYIFPRPIIFGIHVDFWECIF